MDKTGDILVSIRGAKHQRFISGKALDNLREVPAEPDPPYIVGVELDKVIIGWDSNDEGSGLVDQYHIEYKGVSKHDSEWKVAIVKEWARQDDLLHGENKAPPIPRHPRLWPFAASFLTRHILISTHNIFPSLAKKKKKVLDNLPPCSPYVFRVKCRNRRGWSVFSNPSDVAITEAAAPDRPRKVFASKVTPDMVHLHWHAPRDNGEKITLYILRGKRVGGNAHVARCERARGVRGREPRAI